MRKSWPLGLRAMPGGLVSQRRQSCHLIYSVSFETMNALLAYLTENCCGQGGSHAPICDPAASVEATATNELAAGRARCR
jgi:hypothetical protein